MTTGGQRVRWVGQQAIVSMPAEIDATNADEIGQALLAAADHHATVLIIDMSRATFCDSAGVRAIIAAYQQAAATGTQLRLVATAVLRIFTLVGIDKLIPIYPTLEAAMAGAPPAQTSARNPHDGPDKTTALSSRPAAAGGLAFPGKRPRWQSISAGHLMWVAAEGATADGPP
jgi:anti-sigma B factor antagonist